MPTRVRELYLGSRRDAGADAYLRQWQTIDRDIDLAIQEFAPGSIIIKDKFQHRCIGFTGPLPAFRIGSAKRPSSFAPHSPALSSPFWMVSCGHCGAWQRFEERPTGGICNSCGAPLAPEEAHECRTPNGFRTDFRPQPITETELSTGRYRSISAEGCKVDLQTPYSAGTNLRIALQPSKGFEDRPCN